MCSNSSVTMSLRHSVKGSTDYPRLYKSCFIELARTSVQRVCLGWTQVPFMLTAVPYISCLLSYSDGLDCT